MYKLTNKTTRYIASLVLFFFFLILFFYMYFPTESLKNRVITEITSNYGLSVEIGDLDVSPPAVVSISNMKLLREQDEIAVPIDSLKISPSLFSFFRQSRKISFDVRIKKGEIKGVVIYSDGKKKPDSIVAELKEVDLEVIESLLKNKKGIPDFGGEVSGKVDTTGKFELYSPNFSFSGLKLKSFTLPDYNALKADLEGRIEKTGTRLDKLRLENEDFTLFLSGTAPLPWKIEHGNLNIFVRFELKPGSKMGFLKSFMKREKDGSLSARITGPFGRVKFKKN